MRCVRFVMGLVLMAILCAPVMATEGSGISWAFQWTGFPHTSSFGQTAVAMRDGQTWPVIFSANQSAQVVDAYSLYPVLNPMTNTNWHQIGSNVLGGPFGTLESLSAATSPDGRFGVVARSGSTSVATIGSSQSGFSSPMLDVYGIDFDAQGNLVPCTPSTVPNMSSQPVDIAVSPSGDIGVLGSDLVYYQYSPLLEDWFQTSFAGYLPGVPMSTDLELDALGRPHVLSMVSSGGNTDLIALDFNVMTGQWMPSTVDTVSEPSFTIKASAASDSTGVVGAAWVDEGVLKYAYKDGNNPWTTMVVTSSVYDPVGHQHYELRDFQSPGLAFDADDLPVISFVDTSSKIWLAYDPPVDVPEPGAWCLLIGGCLALVLRRRAR